MQRPGSIRYMGYLDATCPTAAGTLNYIELGVLEIYQTEPYIIKNNNQAKVISSYECVYSKIKSHLAFKGLQTGHGEILPPPAYELSVRS